MPSFDVVSNVDMQEVDNALNSVRREIDQRYDFKGSNCTVELDDSQIIINANDNYKMDQIGDLIKTHFTRRKIDSKTLDFQTPESASGNSLRQKINIKQGINSEVAKKVTKHIKSLKLKVQASIRGEELRIEGKKRDDLQNVMQIIKDMKLDLPLQYINFRD